MGGKMSNFQVLKNNKIYATYDSETIRVYQTYSDVIADEAVRLGTFGIYFC